MRQCSKSWSNAGHGHTVQQMQVTAAHRASRNLQYDIPVLDDRRLADIDCLPLSMSRHRVNPGFDGPTLTLFLPSQTKAFIFSLGLAHAGLLSGLLTSCLVAAPGMWPMAYSAFAAAWDTAIFAVDAGLGAGWFKGYVCRRW